MEREWIDESHKIRRYHLHGNSGDEAREREHIRAKFTPDRKKKREKEKDSATGKSGIFFDRFLMSCFIFD